MKPDLSIGAQSKDMNLQSLLFPHLSLTREILSYFSSVLHDGGKSYQLSFISISYKTN